jgi:hypothetical protein
MGSLPVRFPSTLCMLLPNLLRAVQNEAVIEPTRPNTLYWRKVHAVGTLVKGEVKKRMQLTEPFLLC